MADLAEFAAQILAGGIEVVDLTSPLHASTPILQLPPQWGQTQPFQLEEISRYDDRGPAWYWNNIRTGEHTGTHLDAPNHWVTGKDKEDVAQIPPRNAHRPRGRHRQGERGDGEPRLPPRRQGPRGMAGAARPAARRGWLLFRTGWSSRGDDPAAFANADERGRAHPGRHPGRRQLPGRDRAARLRRGDRRHRRRAGVRLHPGVPLPRGGARRGQVRPHPAAQPRQAPGHRRDRRSPRRCPSSAAPVRPAASSPSSPADARGERHR